MLARPDRSRVAAQYDRGVDGYVNVWSEVILPPAETVVAAMRLTATATVIDVGAGTGAVVPAILAASPRGKVIAVDASSAMLRVARDHTDALVAHADALALPVRDRSADAVLFAFTLFHMSDPAQALREATRVLRADGTIGTATWKRSAVVSPPAYDVWDQTLTDAGAPPIPAARVDTGLDSPEAVEELLTSTGFTPTRVWVESLSHQWTAETYFRLATGSGMNRMRLDVLDDDTRLDVLEVARHRLAAVDPHDLLWSGDVVCAVGSAGRVAS